MDLTKRQLAVLQHIRKFLETEGRSPTLKEIADGVGSSAVSTIHKHVQHLIDKGFLGRSHGKGNNIVLAEDAAPGPVPAAPGWMTEEPRRARSIPFYGDVAAGTPLLPESRAIPLEVPNCIHRDRQDLFVLRVRGESMIEDSILDGDLIVLQRRGDYRNGDRIVALIDGEEATLKEYRRDVQGVWLIPHNPDLSPKCFAPDRINIQGVLVGVMRSC
ncbi:MAG: transcriptional repressor LexA [Holophaga sp.]|jgi:SOS regulatory protein LexA